MYTLIQLYRHLKLQNPSISDFKWNTKEYIFQCYNNCVPKANVVLETYFFTKKKYTSIQLSRHLELQNLFTNDNIRE